MVTKSPKETKSPSKPGAKSPVSLSPPKKTGPKTRKQYLADPELKKIYLGMREKAEKRKQKLINKGIKEKLEKGLLVVQDNGTIGRPSARTPLEQKLAQNNHALKWKRKQSGKERDIGPLPINTETAVEGYGAGVPLDKYGKPRGTKEPKGIDWERRLSCKFNLRLFNETYLKPVFYFDWSDDQLRCIKKTEEVFLEGGKFSMAMPRGGGKTAICRGGILWGTAFGHRRFPYFIGSTDTMSLQTLQFLKTHWYQNKLLQQDFPEIGYPVWKLNNRWHLAKGQLYNEEQTYIEWGSDSIRYPCLILPKEIADVYLAHDPDSLRYIADQEVWVPKTGGIPFSCSGIDGSIRGEAETHPVTLEQPRPDVVLLDDVQKDSKADSPVMCGKMINLIDGAVQGLFPPGQQAAVLMPCTVIREGDVADTFLNRTLRPEYQGERCQMVISWPEGITDYEITNDTPAGQLWNKYAEIRRTNLRATGKFNLATEFYRLNQEVMDGLAFGTYQETDDDRGTPHPDSSRDSQEDSEGETSRSGDLRALGTLAGHDGGDTEPSSGESKTQDGGGHNERVRAFICSWASRFDPKVEISAQQHAMNLRLSLGDLFRSEYQNIGRKLVAEGDMLITAEQLACKIINTTRRRLPADVEYLSAFIDVQDEILFWCVFGCNPDFTGVICDYGTWPEVTIPFFNKDNTQSWSLITTRFFQKYPKHKHKAITNSRGKIKAPLEAKIYYALGELVPYLLSLDFVREDTHQKVMKIQKLGIDTRWGQASDSIKRYIRESNHRELVPYFGHAFPPTNRQLEEYELRKGWFFEHQKNPEVREPKWVIRPNAGDGMFYMQADVSRLKDFLFQRLGSPPGSRGSISLFHAPSDTHELFSQHICNSEYPEPVAARNIIKNQWTQREGSAFDNDWLDCAVGCMAISSYLGASLKTVEGNMVPGTRSLSSIRQQKQSGIVTHSPLPVGRPGGIPRVPVSRSRKR